MSRVALVTGGTRGIGAAIATRLKNDGYKVVSSYVGRDDAAQAYSKQSGIEVIKSDVSYFESCKAAVAEVEKKYGDIEIVVNNAGITKDRFLHKMNPEEWNSVINTNLNSN